jgi:Uma2 family endonuclease
MSGSTLLVEDVYKNFTYADYKAWELKPGERFELIYGEAYAMAAPNLEHQSISAILSGEFYTFLKDKPCRYFAAPVDVRLFYEADESDDTVVQPDLIVVCNPMKLGEEGCRGAPDIVIEILSPSNTAIEMERKLNLYWESGVKEYWIVDPQQKQIIAYRMQDGRYVMQAYQLQDAITSAVLPGLTIPLSVIFSKPAEES